MKRKIRILVPLIVITFALPAFAACAVGKTVTTSDSGMSGAGNSATDKTNLSSVSGKSAIVSADETARDDAAAFVSAVAKLGVFDPARDHNDEYKDKIARARDLYAKIASEQIFSVSEELETLVEIETAFSNVDVTETLIKEFRALPAVVNDYADALKIFEFGTKYRSVDEKYKELISVISELTSETIETELIKLYETAGVVSPVYKFEPSFEADKSMKRKVICDGVTENGCVTIDFSFWNLDKARFGDSDYKHAFATRSQSAYITGLKTGGVMEIYARAAGSYPADISVNGETRTVFPDTEGPTVFRIVSGGDFELTTSGYVYVFAVIIRSDPVLPAPAQ